VLQTFDLQKYFSAAIFREDVSRGKPWPDSIVAALQGLGRDLRRNDVIWYIGDQSKDIGAALAASQVIGQTIRPIALGARAALGAVESRLSPGQIMWTPADFERTVQQIFDRAQPEAALMPPLPAPQI